MSKNAIIPETFDPSLKPETSIFNLVNSMRIVPAGQMPIFSPVIANCVERLAVFLQGNQRGLVIESELARLAWNCLRCCADDGPKAEEYFKLAISLLKRCGRLCREAAETEEKAA